jgi:uncharacterized protein Yka (UPF0111/DUF47 family)
MEHQTNPAYVIIQINDSADDIEDVAKVAAMFLSVRGVKTEVGDITREMAENIGTALHDIVIVDVTE